MCETAVSVHSNSNGRPDMNARAYIGKFEVCEDVLVEQDHCAAKGDLSCENQPLYFLNLSLWGHDLTQIAVSVRSAYFVLAQVKLVGGGTFS